MEHCHSLMIPPHFDRKDRMKAFLKSIDERVWLSVENGWEWPTIAIGEWTTDQKEVVSFNGKAMNAIFNVISMEEFKRVSNVEIAHTTWNILQTKHEGTKAVKINKLQQLTSRFESIRMFGDESFMNSMLNWMILAIILLIWVKFMTNLKLLGKFLDH